MERRLEFHNLLISLLGSTNVYFQPPSTVKMKYPCIVYSRSRVQAEYADNKLYSYKTAYSVSVIDSDPDSELIDKVLHLPLCRFDRHYTSDNFNHDVFTIYY